MEVDIRDQVLREVMDLCPRGKLDRCLCKDNTKITWPFSPFDMLTCGVKKVQIHFVASLTTLLIFFVVFSANARTITSPRPSPDLVVPMVGFRDAQDSQMLCAKMAQSSTQPTYSSTT